MNESTVPIIVLSSRQEDVEFVNRNLREAGHAVHCQWIQHIDIFVEAIDSSPHQLIFLFAEYFATPLREIAKKRQLFAPMVPLVVVTQIAEESMITEAMQAGARDLVSITQPERLRSITERELRAFRLERAFNDTLSSAARYRQQLQAFTAGSVDAIAYVQEGIIVDVNHAWMELLSYADAEDALGPLMDHVDTTSQTAMKGALSACSTGRWDSEPLKITAVAVDGSIVQLKVMLENAQFDEEDAIKLSVLGIHSRVEEPEQLIEQAVGLDPITGLYHRRRFVELLTDRLDTKPNSGVRAIAYIRPDKFGEIEKEVGPLASEDIVVQIAQILRAVTHDEDLYGRFGGTVFAMLIERGTIRDIEAWAGNIVARIAEHIFTVSHNTLSISCTIGLAEIGPDTDRIEALMSDAERANQRGRQSGGNQVVLEETSDQSTRIQRADEIWVKQIKLALMENRFRLVHLPIASLNGDSEIMYDTVVRMTDPQGTETAAKEFISAATRNRLLRSIDRWVIAASFAFCGEQSFDRVFVKLSHESIIDKTLLGWIEEQLKATRVSPGRICFQISEEDATQYMKQTNTLAEQLNRKGFFFAVEHFGIGRDPMRVLTQTPMNYLKIDGSLMQSLSSDKALQEKIRGFIKTAEKRQIATIAERIEDANTMAVLFTLGATYMQGHYLQEPEVVLGESLQA